MARKLTRREGVLLVVLAVAAFVVLYSVRETVGDDVRAALDQADMSIVGEHPVVHMALLESETVDYDSEGRNLFEYGRDPVKRPPPVQRPTAPVRRENTPPPAPRQDPPRLQPTATANAGPRPPVIGFKYLGFIGPKDNKIAVFSEDEELMLARVGDVLQGQFQLVDFGYEEVVMGYTDDRFKDQTKKLPQASR